MPTLFRVVALSSLDPDGSDTTDEPELLFPDALKTAEQLRDQGKAFRVHANGGLAPEQTRAFKELGAVDET